MNTSEPRVKPGRYPVLRLAAGSGAALCAWVALDSFLTNVRGANASAGLEFFLFWGVPFAALAVFLGWMAACAHRPEARRTARAGCLAGLIVGAAAFALLLAGPLIRPGDALRGVAAALQYAPLAATLGLASGVLASLLRDRRS